MVVWWAGETVVTAVKAGQRLGGRANHVLADLFLIHASTHPRLSGSGCRRVHIKRLLPPSVTLHSPPPPPLPLSPPIFSPARGHTPSPSPTSTPASTSHIRSVARQSAHSTTPPPNGACRHAKHNRVRAWGTEGLLMHADPQRSSPRRRAPKNDMTTNRPFFGSFLAAFRAQPVIQKAATSQAASAASYSQTAAPCSGQPQDSTTSTTSTRTITAKTRSPSPGATSVAVQTTSQFQPTRQHAAPYHRSSSPTTKAFPIPGASQRHRRGSDSSSEGFSEVMGAEKWYIGGRTATGEEKFYKLGMVKRHRSADRLSLDKLSI